MAKRTVSVRRYVNGAYEPPPFATSPGAKRGARCYGGETGARVVGVCVLGLWWRYVLDGDNGRPACLARGSLLRGCGSTRRKTDSPTPTAPSAIRIRAQCGLDWPSVANRAVSVGRYVNGAYEPAPFATSPGAKRGARR